ncbi:MAG: tripartite tricarboxylate transporter permease [Firmicutes bacterium]|nr:tripartite tricarboxylate transporter permease [Bacillota bacterium]
MLENLMYGLSVALSATNLLYALLGAVVGTVVGVLPGLGPLGAMALLLPATFGLNVTTSMILFAGIYYGSMYGGSTTSILVRVPGEAASVVTCIEGYEMAKKGRAGAALAVSAVGSFIAGTVSIIALTVVAVPLAEAALKFGPPEYLAISLAGLFLLARLTGGDPLKSLIMAVGGLMLGTVGIDSISGNLRFTFGNMALADGIDFLPVAMGLFGIAEILSLLLEGDNGPEAVGAVRFRDLWPNLQEWKRSVGPMLRGSVLGFLVGLIPGPSPVISTMASYELEKRISRGRNEFGRGAIEGVAGPEAANNAAVGGAYVPLLALGLPFTPASAVILAAMIIHGVSPGPLLIKTRPELFWGVVASMYIGNLMLLVFNLPLVGIFAAIARLPKRVLIPAVLILSVVGVYSVNYSTFDVILLGIFGVIGFIAKMFNFEVTPMVLGLVLGPIMEGALRESLMITHGSIIQLVTRPLSGIILALAALVLVLPAIVRRPRQEVIIAEDGK